MAKQNRLPKVTYEPLSNNVNPTVIEHIIKQKDIGREAFRLYYGTFSVNVVLSKSGMAVNTAMKRLVS
jgi:hypothetical protein